MNVPSNTWSLSKPTLRIIQAVLLFLIMVGIGLLATQKLWVPTVVNYMLKQDGLGTVVIEPISPATTSQSAKNAEYTIEGEKVRLVNGEAQSASGMTDYFGNEQSVDVDADGRADQVFFLTQETGGSATFFYVVAALTTATGIVGSEAVFVGDRIAPQSITAGANGTIVVNYVDRAAGDSFAVAPSVGKSLVLKFDPVAGKFVAVKSNTSVPDAGGVALRAVGEFSGVLIRPLSIEEDSRCPADVQCIQAGQVRLMIEVVEDGAAKVLEISSIEGVEAFGRKVVLTGVSPQSSSKQAISNQDYRFTFSVTKALSVTEEPPITVPAPPKAGACRPGGCSGQLCTDEPDLVSTCEYRPEYACYATATCKRQSSGQCGWSETPALLSCLANSGADR